MVIEGEGFKIPIFAKDLGGLQIYNGQRDLVVSTMNRFLTQIDQDAFMHDDESALVYLVLTYGNGEALPDWIVFNGKTGVLKIDPPAGYSGVLVLRLTATDQNGQARTVLFRVFINDADLNDAVVPSFLIPPFMSGDLVVQ
jgi:hypothetical protein